MPLGKFGGYKPGEMEAISDVKSTQSRVMGGDNYKSTLKGKEFISNGHGGSAMSPSSGGAGGNAPTSTGQPHDTSRFIKNGQSTTKQTQNGGSGFSRGSNPLKGNPVVKPFFAKGKN